ncbi:Endothelial differentiation-related factor 1 [Sparganum proliferum]
MPHITRHKDVEPRSIPKKMSSAKLEEESEDFHIETVHRDVGQLIAMARQNCNLTQKDLATKINEKPQVPPLDAEYLSGHR